MPFVHEASAALFKNLIRTKDQGFVIEFRDKAEVPAGADGDSAALQRAARDVRGPRAPPRSTTPIVLGLYQFRTLQGRKALIVVTDGDDNRSHVEYDTLLRYARSAGAPIYFIAVEHPDDRLQVAQGHQARSPRSRAALVFHMSNAEKIGEVTHQIEEELRSQYILAFRSDSPKPPGEYRVHRRGHRKARRDRAYDPRLHSLTDVRAGGRGDF